MFKREKGKSQRKIADPYKYMRLDLFRVSTYSATPQYYFHVTLLTRKIFNITSGNGVTYLLTYQLSYLPTLPYPTHTDPTNNTGRAYAYAKPH